MKTLMKKSIKIKKHTCIFGFIVALFGTPSYGASQQLEDLAEFQAALYFLYVDCQVNMTQEQSQKVTLGFIYDRKISTDTINIAELERLNTQRYRDLAGMDIPLETKCTGLKKTFLPALGN